MSKKVIQINDIHDRIKKIHNSNDYYCDIQEEKLKDFENEMTILGLKFSKLEELPIFLNSPFIN